MPAHIEDCRNNPNEKQYGIVINDDNERFYYDKEKCAKKSDKWLERLGITLPKSAKFPARAWVSGCPVLVQKIEDNILDPISGIEYPSVKITISLNLQDTDPVYATSIVASANYLFDHDPEWEDVDPEA